MNKGHIFFISGVAGAGKGTVIKKLMDKKIGNFELALSCKTRDFRGGEKPGVDYNKLSIEEFKLAIESGDFLEYNFVHNQNYYGTRYTDVIENGIDLGKIILKEMDILALPKFKYDSHSIRENYSYIFLDLPIDKIKDRMSARGDSTQGKDFENRIKSAKKEIALKNLADHVVDADQAPEKVFEDVFNIISKKL
ncbi:hypothetical protein N8455_00315 [Candidatus Gracilibacteria bacterium]|nr:hypothetical protein [Candidatus Gracilibacteria bacterium]